MNHLHTYPPASRQVRLMADNADQYLRQIRVPSISNLQFQIDGIPFQAFYEPEGNHTKLQLWSTLGYMPYSVESADRRRVLIEILESLRPITTAQFGINKENQIVVMQTFTVSDIQPPAFIFVPMIAFLQGVLPFIRLIGECL